MKFNTKKDKIYYIIIFICIIITFIGVALIIKKVDLTSITVFVSAFLMDIIFFPIIYHSYYKLTKYDLVIRLGFIKINIPYTSILKYFKIENSIAAAATSTKRVQIDYVEENRKNKFNTIYISPVNRDLFIEELKKSINKL